MEIGLRKDLNLKPGDVVQFQCILHYHTNYDVFIPGKDYTVDQDGMFTSEHGSKITGNSAVWRIVSRASDDNHSPQDASEPKLWRYMTDAEKSNVLDEVLNDPTNPLQILWDEWTPEAKGALLLAHHEGKEIELRSDFTDDPEWIYVNPSFKDWCTYRVKPEPVRWTVTLYCDTENIGEDPLPIGTIDLIDGEPDYNSIQMETIK